MNNLNSVRLLSLGSLAALVIAVVAILATVLTASAFAVTVSVSPASQNANIGDTITVRVRQNADVVTTGLQTDVGFDRTKLQATSIARGGAYTGASLLPGDLATAMTTANTTTGVLANLAVFFSPGAGTVLAGDREGLVITFQVIDCGASPFTLGNVEVLDDQGNVVPATLNNGSVDIPCPTPTPVPTPSPEPTPTPAPTPVPTPPPPSTGQTRVSGSVPPGFIQITVPSEVTIPLERETTNTADVPVEIDSDTLWQLNTSDPKPTNKGYMTTSDVPPKVLKNSMRVAAGANLVDLQTGGLLASGSGDSLINAELRQVVVPADAPGNYGIDVLFEAVGGF